MIRPAAPLHFKTHETDTNGTVLPIVLGNQNENNGTRVDNLSAALSIAKVKVHDQSLTLEQVQQSYGQDMKKFGKVVDSLIMQRSSLKIILLNLFYLTSKMNKWEKVKLYVFSAHH